jgi:hypothetical protein
LPNENPPEACTTPTKQSADRQGMRY